LGGGKEKSRPSVRQESGEDREKGGVNYSLDGGTAILLKKKRTEVNHCEKRSE